MHEKKIPILVPTALSHSVILWSAVFVICFGVAVFAYSTWCRYDEARAALGEKAPTTSNSRFTSRPAS